MFTYVSFSSLCMLNATQVFEGLCFFFLRERVSTQVGGEGWRERDNLKRAPHSAEPNMGLDPMTLRS